MAKSWQTVVVYRIVENEIRRLSGRYLRGRMIDIGCGTKPFASVLAPHVSEYVGLDRGDPFDPSARADLVGSAYEIPSGSGSFDSALSTAALEHLADPQAALRECYRVLKAGGFAVYTIPHIWHLHAQPHDYFRFTKYGIDHVFRAAGFEIVEIRALSGFLVTFATLASYYLARFHRWPLNILPVIPLVALSLQWIAYGVEKLDRAEDWTWMYSVVARKPLDGLNAPTTRPQPRDR